MVKHFKYLIKFVIVSLSVHGVDAKPRVVVLEKELINAAFVGLVVVDSYSNDGNILFHSLEYTDTLKKAFVNHKGPDGYKFPNPGANYWTAYLPFKMDTVLIVVDKEKSVSLFARKINANYRFWSPYFTGSIALFYFSNQARKLPDQKERKTSLVNLGSCWDGCLLPIEKLSSYFNKETIHEFTGYATMNNNKAVFIWDFADSAIYYLEGLAKWKKKYLNKRITIKGDLITEGNNTVFKNWKIVE